MESHFRSPIRVTKVVSPSSSSSSQGPLRNFPPCMAAWLAVVFYSKLREVSGLFIEVGSGMAKSRKKESLQKILPAGQERWSTLVRGNSTTGLNILANNVWIRPSMNLERTLFASIQGSIPDFASPFLAIYAQRLSSTSTSATSAIASDLSAAFCPLFNSRSSISSGVKEKWAFWKLGKETKYHPDLDWWFCSVISRYVSSLGL